MQKCTQKQLRALVASGAAIDVTHEDSRAAIPESYEKIGYSLGKYGQNGLLLRGDETGRLYAVTSRSVAVFTF